MLILEEILDAWGNYFVGKQRFVSKRPHIDSDDQATSNQLLNSLRINLNLLALICSLDTTLPDIV
jgi:hypothetical protein